MRQFTCPKAVTHPSTNRARCRATALIETNALPLHQTANLGHRTKCGAGRICGADLIGDNLRISRTYLRICDHCIVAGRVRIRVTVWVRVRVKVRIKVRVSVWVRVRFRVANCCIQTAGEGAKMRINHVIKTDQWRCASQIRPAPHFVVSGCPVIMSGVCLYGRKRYSICLYCGSRDSTNAAAPYLNMLWHFVIFYTTHVQLSDYHTV